MSAVIERETELAPDVTGDTVIGVLLMAYGSPRNLDEVEPYLQDIRGGKTPSPEAVEELKERYRKIGGHSPLLEITQRQAEALRSRLDATFPGRYRTYVGMKHWHPYIAEAVSQMIADGVTRVLGVVMAPHYSQMSVGGYQSRLQDAVEALGATIEVGVIPNWYDDAGFVGFSAENLRIAAKGWKDDGSTRVIFTAHSLPERILQAGDPYPDQLLDSSQLVAGAAGADNWEFAFQSASETGVPWLGPDLMERLGAFAAEGGRRALVYPIGFVADHLEILYDLDIEASELAGRLGLEFRRTPSPNDDPAFMDALAGIVKTRGG
jgi:ferrochelatase